MQSRYSRFFQFIIIFGDLLLLNGCFILSMSLRFEEIQLQNTDYYNYYVQLVLFFNISWLLLTFAFRTYETHRTLEPRKATSKVLNVYFLHIFLLLLVMVSLKKDVYSRLFLIYFYSSLLVTILPWRFFFLRLLRGYRKRGYNYRSVILVGDDRILKKFYDTVALHPEYGLRIDGYYSDNAKGLIPLSGTEKDLETKLNGNFHPDEIFCAYPTDDKRLLWWFHTSDKLLIRFRVVPDLALQHSQGIAIDFYHDVPVLVHRKEPLEYFQNRILKRVGDIAFSILVIILVFPWAFPLLALGVKLSSKGPVFFKQRRTGLQNREFTIYKFRSMTVNSKADEEQVVKYDTRVTAFGAFIRKHNLDELPQFFNVLRGDMSIVGPRPHMLAHTLEYRKIIDEYMVRHLAKPGITGLAQINGYRGEIQVTGDIKERVRQDVYYIENWSVLLDVKIILVTIIQTITGGKRK